MSKNSQKQDENPEYEQAEGDSAEESPVINDDGQDQEAGTDEFEDVSRNDLVQMLVEARQQIDEMKDGYIRARADVENIQRRSQNEMVSARKFAIEGFARELLSVIDSLNQAAMVKIDETQRQAVERMNEGLGLTLKQLEKVMEKFGIVQVEADTGTRFNPDIHQAISMVDSIEVEADHIVSVMQKGFTLKDRLLRPAMVVIAN
jgi:molecular chaperone GrpE